MRSLPESGFDIYQTESGYTAVTNEVRRQILNALAKKDRQLPDLVKITKKSKPTLSSVHMKELLAAGLVEEITHPTDKRKKIYRLAARRIGSSALPVDQLRSAVKQYVSTAPGAARLPLTTTFEAMAAAPPDCPVGVLRQQSVKLGLLSVGLFQPVERRELVTSLAAFLEREGLARPLRLDLESLRLDMELSQDLPGEVDEGRLALLVAGFVEGVLRGRGDVQDHVSAESLGNRRFRLLLPEWAGALD